MALRPVATVVNCPEDKVNYIPSHLCVEVKWTGAKLDRTDATNFGLKLSHGALAARLVKAINAGAVFANPRVLTDTNGRTYVDASCVILARTMNADLRRLGY